MNYMIDKDPTLSKTALIIWAAWVLVIATIIAWPVKPHPINLHPPVSQYELNGYVPGTDVVHSELK